MSLRAQLEPEHEIPEIRQSQLQLIHEKTRIVTKRFTCDNQISLVNRKLVLLCEGKVVLAKVQSWKDYIHRLEQDKGVNWLTVLKAALEIF